MFQRRSTMSRVGRTAAASVAISVMVMCSPPAHADPVIDYTSQVGAKVCVVLDASPSFVGVNIAANAIRNDGFTTYQAGEVIALAVGNYCPRHISLLRAYVSAAEDNSGRPA
ncbi:Bacteriophage protein [Mycobacteroides abscessus]|uniref:Bacteriophage protein n=1 Tax=Mycobacteroides abscessus subsp. massiliense TaxID=1962118 RepID=A0AB38DHY0_9MYCO|nr:Bacteriophage protein [Mycobacteroides abscessus]SKD21120.1 Bacteriophage protein [Mycobacteroides abscessus subsp. massiliense]CPS51551.1 Bacteriophage protein [Mycobacteroides abscessus]CPT09770.1 Bacteriophage protein [Mycobacteroides abscessus]CPT74777.1 Bacteriophage protein [Mycobacteroides abscessus]